MNRPGHTYQLFVRGVLISVLCGTVGTYDFRFLLPIRNLINNGTFLIMFSWTPDSSHVLTTSRDGSCKIWRVTELSESSQHTDLVCVETFSPFSGIAVTAVDVYTPAVDTTQSIAIAATGWLVALGAETGELQVVRINPSLLSAKPCAGDVGESAAAVVSIVAVPEGHCHGATVRRIRWRPRSGGECVEFASCGEDKTVRVHQLVA